MISATTMAFDKKVHTNVVFDNGSKMISLSLDNGVGGGLSRQSRGDLRLLFTDPLEGGVKDVTSTVFLGANERQVPANVENMDRAMKWLQMSSWGFARPV